MSLLTERADAQKEYKERPCTANQHQETKVSSQNNVCHMMEIHMQRQEENCPGASDKKQEHARIL